MPEKKTPRTALVTGANRGIGRALVEALLARGAERVYAAARDPGAVDLRDPRVTPLALDVTDPGAVERAAAEIDALDLLVNNAGVLASFDLLESGVEALQRDLDVNYFGPLHTARAFLPALEARRGAVVNVLTIASLAAMPGIGGYGASKAAAWSMTMALRAQLAEKGVRVHAVFPGPVDTDMIKGFPLDKTAPEEVAAAILDGVEAGTEDIFPDPMSRDSGALWLRDPKALEARFGAS